MLISIQMSDMRPNHSHLLMPWKHFSLFFDCEGIKMKSLEKDEKLEVKISLVFLFSSGDSTI